eukprot:1405256-Rhodomonas_salina.1
MRLPRSWTRMLRKYVTADPAFVVKVQWLQSGPLFWCVGQGVLTIPGPRHRNSLASSTVRVKVLQRRWI